MPFFSLSSSRVLVTHHLDRCKRHLWRDAGQLVAGSDGAGQQLTLNWMVYVPPPSQRPLPYFSVEFEEDRRKLGVCLTSGSCAHTNVHTHNRH